MAAKSIGITGSIGAGKSLVGRLLQERGYKVIDTDQVVHDLFETNEAMRDAITANFGIDVLTNGKIDRAKLGAIVFDNPDARKTLENIVHPAVRKFCDEEIEKMSPDTIAFTLIPLLFEAHLEKHFSEIWTVRANESTLRSRLKEHRQMTDEQITKRLQAQISQEEKVSRSDRVIDNTGTILDTTEQLDDILKQLEQKELLR